MTTNICKYMCGLLTKSSSHIQPSIHKGCRMQF